MPSHSQACRLPWSRRASRVAIETDAANRWAHYTNLDPGSYVLHVKASNSDNVWNEDGAQLVIDVKPPFWKTPWFLTLVALVVQIVIVVSGAAVRLTGSGLGCSDWPACQEDSLVAPLEYRRISSSFSTARRHPILGVVRPHRGIDYAAAPGAPLWSVADGTVIYRGWAGASGNLVKIMKNVKAAQELVKCAAAIDTEFE